jgi:hypothetical protein
MRQFIDPIGSAARLPKLAHDKIKALVEEYGLTKTQVVILAVDRFARELTAQAEDAHKDARMLKTVARIAPHLDLGQDG